MSFYHFLGLFVSILIKFVLTRFKVQILQAVLVHTSNCYFHRCLPSFALCLLLFPSSLLACVIRYVFISCSVAWILFPWEVLCWAICGRFINIFGAVADVFWICYSSLYVGLQFFWIVYPDAISPIFLVFLGDSLCWNCFIATDRAYSDSFSSFSYCI